MKSAKTIEPRRADPAAPGIRASADSHPGLQRDHNEDRCHYDVGRGIFLVVDGVGGHAAGDIAADTAVSVVRERLERETGPVEDRIREAIALANNNIHRLASWKPEWRGMGCVLTVAVVAGGRAVVGHVGDTRLYKLRGERVDKITRDHSPVGEREDAQELSEAEAMRHPRRNEVYRDVGSEPHEPGDPGFVDLLEVPFEPDAALLLCSDGLSDTVSSATIGQIVRTYAGHPYEVVRALIDAANEAGGKDNVTVVYVEGGEFGRAQLALPLAAPARPLQLAQSSADPPAPAPVSRRRWPTIALVVALLIVAAAAGLLLLWQRGDLTLPSAPLLMRSPIVTVRPGESIGAAIDGADAGSTIVVEPGEYREQIRLKSGVRVRSRVPRGAALRLRGDATESDPAVVATDVTEAELAGFRIVGDAATPLGVGIYVRNAEVTLADVDVTGAVGAALELVEGTRGSVTAVDIHDNPGSGLVIRSGASPRVAHSQFIRNGGSERGLAAVLIESGSHPVLNANVFQGITPDVLTGLTQIERDALKQANWFIGSDPGRSSSPPPRRPPQGRR